MQVFKSGIIGQLVLLLLFIFPATAQEKYKLYELPRNGGYPFAKLAEEIKNLPSLKEVEKVILSHVPNFKGEIIVVVNEKNSQKFFWILDDKRKAQEFRITTATKGSENLRSIKELRTVCFKDTLVIMDTLMIDLSDIDEIEDFDHTRFLLKVRSNERASFLNIPSTKYKQLILSRGLFPKNADSTFKVQVINALYPNQILGDCIFFFPTDRFKKDLLEKAGILYSGSANSLDVVAEILRIDISRKGTINYRHLRQWLEEEFKFNHP